MSPDTSVESLQIFQFGNYSVKRRFRGINDDDVPSHHTLICNVVTKLILNTFKATYCQCNKKCDQSLLLRNLYIYKRQKLIIWFFLKIRTGLMAHLRLMTINTASTFIRGGMIHKLIWYSLISIGNVCYVNTYNISFFKKYSSNDHAEKLQCLLTIRIRYYVIEWQAKVLGFFSIFLFQKNDNCDLHIRFFQNL